ncbi:DUF692 family multinuclear iron-containing protein [Streptomyces sp. NBC_00096]|uniref:multinuclear nonheme iron-dependent oxidase n=1 Tax=Streptomyces sp. NBC_00096 TaxID=2975650 RepID=UPI0032552448
MLIGVNVTSPDTLEMACRLRDSGHIDFVEVLIDGFAHLDPKEFRRTVGDLPVGCHIMLSRFLDPDRARLEHYLNLVNQWQADCGLLYVSDHIAHFSHNGQPLPVALEVDYAAWQPVIDSVRAWQDQLGTTLAVENFPSQSAGDIPQARAYAELTAATGCEVLMDVSNAMVAQLNTGQPAAAWAEVPGVGRRFHLAGYSPSPAAPSLIVDSHDVPVSDDTLDLVTLFAGRAAPDATLVVERDANHDLDEWRTDLDRTRAAAVAAQRLHQPHRT